MEILKACGDPVEIVDAVNMNVYHYSNASFAP